MAATQRYVNTSAAAGGDGTNNLETESVALAGDHAYPDLSTWEAAEDGITMTDPHIVDCDRGTTTGTDNTAFTIGGWTGNSATNTITIRANRGSVNGFNDTGTFDSTTFYTIEHDAVGTYHLETVESYVIFDGLQFLHSTATASRRLLRANANSSTVQNCYFSKTSTGTSAYGLFSDGLTAVVTNCVFSGFNDTGDTGAYFFGSSLLYNSTFYDCDTAIVLSGAIDGIKEFKARNCEIFNCGTDLTDASSSTAVTFDYNATDDPASGTADPRGTNGQDLDDNTTLWDEAVRARASGDFRIDSEASLLYNTGVSNATDANVPTTDMLGNIRYSDDIGAFAYSSTEIRRFINTSAAAGGDGFTNDETTNAAGHLAYIDMNTWEAAENVALASASVDQSHLVDCDRGTTVTIDDSLPNISGWTTSATNTILIRGNRNSVNGFNNTVAYDGTTFYTLQGTIDSNAALVINEQFVTVDGLQIVHVSTSSSKRCVTVGSTGTIATHIILENCWFKSTADGSTQTGVHFWHAASAGTVRNCVFIDFLAWNSLARAIYINGGPAHVYNNTFYDCDVAIELDTDLTGAIETRIKNNLIFNCGNDLDDGSVSATDVVFDYNATDDPATGFLDPRGTNGQDLNDDTALWDAAVRARASDDFRIDSEDSLLYNTGLSNAADSNVPLLDYLGNIRHSDDIGAFAYSSTEIRRFVNLSADASGNGFTNFETSALAEAAGYPVGWHAYVDLVTWVSVESTNLTTNENTHLVECDMGSTGSQQDTIVVDLSGFTTSADYFPTIKSNRASATGFNTTGIIDENAYYTVKMNSGIYFFYTSSRKAGFDGLQAVNNAADPFAYMIPGAGGSIHNCLIHNTGTSTTARGVVTALSGTNIKNCVFTGFKGSGSSFALRAEHSSSIYNSTFYDNKTGILLQNAVNHTLKNCLAFNNTDDLSDTSTGTFTEDYNASDDADMRVTNGVNLNENASSEWDNAVRARASADFRIDSEASTIYNAGTSNAVDSNVPLLDILGNVRHSDDIGAFAYSSTEIRRFINLSADASGNGFTNYETSAVGVTAGYPANYHAYVDMTTWEAAEGTDLVTDTNSHVVDCDMGSTTIKDTVVVTIEGWTINETYPLTVRGNRATATGFNATGIWDPTSYYTRSVNDFHSINHREASTTFDGIQIEIAKNGTNTNGITSNTSDAINNIIQNCIFSVISGYSSRSALFADGNNSDWALYNNVFITIGNGIYGAIYSDGEILAYNNTFYNCTRAINLTVSVNDPVSFKNNVVFNSGTEDYLDDGIGTRDVDYNATDDPASGTAVPRGVNGVDLDDNTGGEWTASFTDHTTADFTVKNNTSLIFDAGVNNATDSNVPLLDILGNTRTFADIGAFAFTGAGPGLPPIRFFLVKMDLSTIINNHYG